MGMPSHFYTIGYVARLRGEGEDAIQELVFTCMGPFEGTISDRR